MLKSKISICIPKYNRANSLINYHQSIVTEAKEHIGSFEICVFDDDKKCYFAPKEQLEITYHRNDTNLGIP